MRFYNDIIKDTADGHCILISKPVPTLNINQQLLCTLRNLRMAIICLVLLYLPVSAYAKVSGCSYPNKTSDSCLKYTVKACICDSHNAICVLVLQRKKKRYTVVLDSLNIGCLESISKQFSSRNRVWVRLKRKERFRIHGIYFTTMIFTDHNSRSILVARPFYTIDIGKQPCTTETENTIRNPQRP
ncbi:MAG: hypothetical protein RL660_45 [Bacteroidota bacterium]|jgi:hypothetical protein